ncbi:hypothetical protein Tco_1337879 [Tanacetum coccineum]
MITIRKRVKLNLRYIRPSKILAKVGTVAYRLELPKELSRVYSTFHVSNLKKCLSDEQLVICVYGYCKYHKKTVKVGQTWTRERKENTKDGRMLSKSYASPKLLIGGNPQEGAWWHCKKHTRKRKFALKELKKKHNGSDTRNATLTIRVLTKVIQRLIIGLDRAGQALGILPALEVAPPVETAPDTEITSTTLKSHTMVSTPPKGLGPSTEDPLETDVNLGARGDGEKTNLHHPVDLKAAPVTQAIGSQEIKGARR